ncbi:MAG: iron uptake porin [Thermosynechococcaceae cyanobacterium]
MPSTLAETLPASALPSAIPDQKLNIFKIEADPADLKGQNITPVWQLQEESKPALEDSPKAEEPPRKTGKFLPITQLSGEAVFSLIYAARNRDTEAIKPSLGNRLRLDFETSFSGEDQLRFRLQTTNVAELDDVFETDLARLSIQGEDQNQIELSRLDYTFPIGDRTKVFVQAVGGSLSDIADPLNPLFSSSGSGSISRFGQRNPLYRQGGSTGVGVSHDFSDRVNLSAGYFSDAENLLPDEEYIAFAQVTVEPTETLALGLLYAYAFNGLDTGTGHQRANDPFADQSDAIASHSLGLQATASLTPDIVLSGWAGWTRAIATDLAHTPEADILNWAITLGYLDVLGEGNQMGLVIGYPPQVLGSQPPFHVELSYKIQMNEHISVTPGIMMVTQPETQASPIVTGIIRTTFRF